jgi:glucose-1-phosphate cytidylyltransferase
MFGHGAEHPKPMVEIGDRPMVHHIVDLFARAGVEEVVVACGYLGEEIKRYFVDRATLSGDVTVDLATGDVKTTHAAEPSCRVRCVDTGRDTMTGARLRRVASHLPQDRPFFLTYGDGVSDVDLRALSDHHAQAGRQVTVTAVHPPARFGELSLDGERVAAFAEKPQVGAGWINGGFFVVEPSVLRSLPGGDDLVFEEHVLTRLAKDDQLSAFRHEGFWQCMDTPRDVATLQRLWAGGAPWAGHDAKERA